MQESKRCSKCGETKPPTEFSKRTDSKDGLGSRCKQCVAAVSAKRYREDEAFRERIKDRTNARRLADPEAHRAEVKRWRAENAESVYRKMTEWNAAHPEAVRAIKKRWDRSNREARRDTVRRRRSRLQGVPTIRFSVEQLEQRMSMFGNRCWICRGPRDEVDHVKPVAKGGAHMLCNLRPVCRTCNARKNDRWPLE